MCIPCQEPFATFTLSFRLQTLVHTVERKWLEHRWNHENMFETEVVRAYECDSLRKVTVRHNRDIFSIFFNMKVSCVFSLESPHRGGSYEHTQYTIFNKNTLNYPKFAAMGFFRRDSGTSSKQPW